MKKEHVMNRNKDYRRAYNRGKFSSSPILVTYAVRNRFRIKRFGITTTKKTGIAVQRNRARRIIRAALAKLKHRILNGYDIVFVSRKPTCEMKTQDVFASMERELLDLGLLQ